MASDDEPQLPAAGAALGTLGGAFADAAHAGKGRFPPTTRGAALMGAPGAVGRLPEGLLVLQLRGGHFYVFSEGRQMSARRQDWRATAARR